MSAAAAAPAVRRPANGGAAAAPAGGGGGSGPGAGGGFPMGSPDQMQLLMKHLPTILNVAKKAPGVVVGFTLTMLYMLLWMGRSGFRDTIAPVGGFHILVFFLVRELWPLWRTGQERAYVAKERKSAQKAFANDIAMQYREKLD